MLRKIRNFYRLYPEIPKFWAKFLDSMLVISINNIFQIAMVMANEKSMEVQSMAYSHIKTISESPVPEDKKWWVKCIFNIVRGYIFWNSAPITWRMLWNWPVSMRNKWSTDMPWAQADAVATPFIITNNKKEFSWIGLRFVSDKKAKCTRAGLGSERISF